VPGMPARSMTLEMEDDTELPSIGQPPRCLVLPTSMSACLWGPTGAAGIGMPAVELIAPVAEVGVVVDAVDDPAGVVELAALVDVVPHPARIARNRAVAEVNRVVRILRVVMMNLL